MNTFTGPTDPSHHPDLQPAGGAGQAPGGGAGLPGQHCTGPLGIIVTCYVYGL